MTSGALMRTLLCVWYYLSPFVLTCWSIHSSFWAVFCRITSSKISSLDMPHHGQVQYSSLIPISPCFGIVYAYFVSVMGTLNHLSFYTMENRSPEINTYWSNRIYLLKSMHEWNTCANHILACVNAWLFGQSLLISCLSFPYVKAKSQHLFLWI
jgi:hypothetical protein